MKSTTKVILGTMTFGAQTNRADAVKMLKLFAEKYGRTRRYDFNAKAIRGFERIDDQTPTDRFCENVCRRQNGGTVGDVMGEEKSIASLRVASKVRRSISLHTNRSHTHTHTGKSMVRRSLESWSEKTIGGFSESAQE